MSVIERARTSGKCPPSLLKSESADDNGFEAGVAKVLDASGTFFVRCCMNDCSFLVLTLFCFQLMHLC
jgi:hypothetical protein